MMNLNHPNIVRAYHCITKQMAADQASSTLEAQQQAAGSAQPSAASSGGKAAAAVMASATAVPSGGAGSGGWAGSPGSQATTAGSLQQKQQQQRQITDFVPLPDQSSIAPSFVPYVGFSSVRLPGRIPDSVSSTAAAAASLRQGSNTTASSPISVTTLTPATPSPSGGIVAPPSTLGSTSVPTGTSSSTQLGVFSSSGLSYLAQDLDAAVGPVYQRRQQLSPLLSSAGSGSADTFSGTSSATMRAAPVQPGNPAPETAATGLPGSGRVGSFGPAGGAGFLAIGRGGNGGSQTVLPVLASSSGVPGGLQQQQQQLWASPSSGPSIVGSSVNGSSSAASGSNASRPWHVMFSANSEVQPASDGGSAGVQGVGEFENGSAGSSGGDRGTDRSRTWRPPAAMCETWLVTELCDR
jgi:hypothetical protein